MCAVCSHRHFQQPASSQNRGSFRSLLISRLFLHVFRQRNFPTKYQLRCTHWKFNIAPENLPSQKESSLAIIIFQGRAVKLRVCNVYHVLYPCLKFTKVLGSTAKTPWYSNTLHARPYTGYFGHNLLGGPW